jgi:hypothetical protein
MLRRRPTEIKLTAADVAFYEEFKKKQPTTKSVSTNINTPAHMNVNAAPNLNPNANANVTLNLNDEEMLPDDSVFDNQVGGAGGRAVTGAGGAVDHRTRQRAREERIGIAPSGAGVGGIGGLDGPSR